MFVFDPDINLLDRVISLRSAVIARSTGGSISDDFSYEETRRYFLTIPHIKNKLPNYILKYDSLDYFWQFIKHEYSTYAERRNFIWESFSPLIAFLEAQNNNPSDESITSAIEKFDATSVQNTWQKALDRRITDPEAAITSARALLESTCKHILDEKGIEYDNNMDLPKLWFLCAKELNLSPDQHSEVAFKAILGGCQTIVNNLGTLRNLVGDAHGKGKKAIKPKARHAELAVNLAGSMAAFLVSTWKEQTNSD